MANNTNAATTPKPFLYTRGANADAHYGPWDSIDQYVEWLTSKGFSAPIEAVTICVKNSDGTLQKYVREGNAWREDGGKFIKEAEKGVANGVAPLGDNGKISETYLPAYIDHTEAYANLAAIQAIASPSANVIYVANDTGFSYRYCATATPPKFIEVSKQIAFGKTSGTAYEGSNGAALESDIEDIDERLDEVESEIDSLNDNYVKRSSQSTSNNVCVIVDNELTPEPVLMKTDIVNGLSTDDNNKVLSASQGVVISGKFGKFEDLKTNAKGSVVDAINEIYNKAFSAVEKFTVKIKVSTNDDRADAISAVKTAYVEIYDYSTDKKIESFSGSCSNGEREFDCAKGAKFKAKFLSIDGFDLVAPEEVIFQANNQYNEVAVEYGKPTIYNSEKVVVRLLNYSTEEMVVVGEEVTLTFADGNGNQSGKTNAEGVVSFNVSRRDANYTITAKSSYSKSVVVSGSTVTKTYNCTGSNTYTSKVSTLQKDVCFTYREEGMGVLIVEEDGTETHYANWILGGAEKWAKAKFVRIAGDSYNFMVSLGFYNKCITGDATTLNSQKCKMMATNDYVSYFDDANSYDGSGDTKRLLQLYEDRTIESALAELIISGFAKDTLNGNDITPYVPTVKEWQVLVGADSILTNIYNKRYSTTQSAMTSVYCTGNVGSWSITRTESNLASFYLRTTTTFSKVGQTTTGRFFPFYKDGGNV